MGSLPPGLHRTSVFDRLGAETKADTTTGNKVSWRLGSHSGLSNYCPPWVLFLTLPHLTPATLWAHPTYLSSLSSLL